MRFPGTRQASRTDGLATAMGLFSYGLGLAQLTRTGGVNRLMGIPDDDANHTLQQAIGIRELISGTGILRSRNTTPWLWFRVAGDLMDLAVLGLVFASGLGKRKHLIGSISFIASVLAVDVAAATRRG